MWSGRRAGARASNPTAGLRPSGGLGVAWTQDGFRAGCPTAGLRPRGGLGVVWTQDGVRAGYPTAGLGPGGLAERGVGGGWFQNASKLLASGQGEGLGVVGGGKKRGRVGI